MTNQERFFAMGSCDLLPCHDVVITDRSSEKETEQIVKNEDLGSIPPENCIIYNSAEDRSAGKKRIAKEK